MLAGYTAIAQDEKVGARIDAAQIMVGDHARLFVEAQHNTATSKLQWAAIPDTFNGLEIVEKGKIDTIKKGNLTTYKQRLLITGFDSGMHTVPPFTFTILPANGTPQTLQTDSFPMLVQTVAVDTTQPFKGIKGIMQVQSTWLDYIGYIIGAIILIVLVTVVVVYFIRNKKTHIPVAAPAPPKETPNEKALRLLAELEQQQLWQNNQPKEYHTQLVDTLRLYIEERFGVNVMELTSDEILHKVALHKEMTAHRMLLSNIFYIADLAKFAKAQPTPQEHLSAMDYAKEFVLATKPVVVVEPQTPAAS
ncbi:hypothetical protein CAP35_03350 [Chitinophagaceae bacterium IBVUCB1]|nr:hypothetical protein CAP35_03350 [Chitinophagaceae bacterium IBVUCB1]